MTFTASPMLSFIWIEFSKPLAKVLSEINLSMVLDRMNESQEEDGEPRDRTMIALLLQLDFPRFQDDDAFLRDAHAVMDFYLDPRTQADTASMIRAYTPALVHLPNPCEQGGLAHGWGPASPNLAAPAGSSSGDSTEAAIVASAPSGMYIDS